MALRVITYVILAGWSVSCENTSSFTTWRFEEALCMASEASRTIDTNMAESITD